MGNINSFSVVICVYTEKRWDQICAAVESVRAQSVPGAELILVVDHNPALYKRIISAMPDVNVVENREAQGLSGGRNTGAALAHGDIIAFLDDDAAAHPDWLKFLGDAYANPDVIGVGGLTLPRWQTKSPAWFPVEFYWVIACNYTGMPDSGQPVRNLVGVNMSFRRVAFELVDGFRTGIGRTAGKLPLGCEETEFCIRLGQRSPGSLLVTEHRAVAWHWVPDDRCRFSYFMSRCFAEGISKAQVASEVGRGDGLSAERSYVTRTLPLGVLKGIVGLLRGDFRGLARSAAIVVGLSLTVTGYVVGVSRSQRKAKG
jgi:glycosyltransferase involved in cell wall biosynthesis